VFKYLITISLIRCVRTLQIKNNFIAATVALNYKIIIYIFIFIKAIICYFYLLTIILTILIRLVI